MCGEANEFEFEFKRREINKIGKLRRCGEATEFEFEFKRREINKIGKSRCGEAIEFEFEFKGWKFNEIEKSRCTSLNLNLKGRKLLKLGNQGVERQKNVSLNFIASN